VRCARRAADCVFRIVPRLEFSAAKELRKLERQSGVKAVAGTTTSSGVIVASRSASLIPKLHQVRPPFVCCAALRGTVRGGCKATCATRWHRLALPPASCPSHPIHVPAAAIVSTPLLSRRCVQAFGADGEGGAGGPSFGRRDDDASLPSSDAASGVGAGAGSSLDVAGRPRNLSSGGGANPLAWTQTNPFFKQDGDVPRLNLGSGGGADVTGELPVVRGPAVHEDARNMRRAFTNRFAASVAAASGESSLGFACVR
jgi:hypothetical protein